MEGNMSALLWCPDTFGLVAVNKISFFFTSHLSACEVLAKLISPRPLTAPPVWSGDRAGDWHLKGPGFRTIYSCLFSCLMGCFSAGIWHNESFTLQPFSPAIKVSVTGCSSSPQSFWEVWRGCDRLTVSPVLVLWTLMSHLANMSLLSMKMAVLPALTSAKRVSDLYFLFLWCLFAGLGRS